MFKLNNTISSSSVVEEEDVKNTKSDEEEALERLEERLKMQKKLYDFLKKGMRNGPSFLYELRKKTEEIMNDGVI